MGEAAFIKLLQSLPTLCVGQGDNLKLERDGIRIWVSREEFPTFSIEFWNEKRHRWETL